MEQRLYDPPIRRRVGILPILFLAVACASWVATVAWNGRESLSMGIDAAILVAADPNQSQTKRAAAASTLRRDAERAIVVLRALADEPGAVGNQARAALQHLHAATGGQ